MPKKSKQGSEKKDFLTSTEILLDSAGRILKKTGASAIMVYVDLLPSIDALECLPEGVHVILVTRQKQNEIENIPGVRTTISVPAYSFTRMDQIKLASVIGLTRGVIESGHKIVCLTGIAGSGKLDTLMVLDLAGEFEIFSGHAGELLTEDVFAEVLIRAIDLSVRMSHEGREGKPVGTCFILGDNESVISYSRQMTLNPFRGYEEEERNILSPELEETVKEFASIDGAYIVRGDGVIITAAAYLQPPGGEKPLEPGLGARHAAASALTEATEALAIVLSESTGTVRLYKKGMVVMAVERPTGHI